MAIKWRRQWGMWLDSQCWSYYPAVSCNVVMSLQLVSRSGYRWSMKPKAKIHDDVIKWEHFLCYWPFVRWIHLLPMDSPHKGQWRGALMFSLICAWTKRWANNRDARALRRHRAHCDVTVMRSYFAVQWLDFMHWRRVTHRCVGKLTSIGSNNCSYEIAAILSLS